MNHHLIFAEWKSKITRKDRRHENLETLYESLFTALRDAGLSSDDAYVFCGKAKKFLHPSHDIVAYTYKSVSSKMSMNKFKQDWIDDVERIGEQVFFEVYPISESLRSLNRSISSASDADVNNKNSSTDDKTPSGSSDQAYSYSRSKYKPNSRDRVPRRESLGELNYDEIYDDLSAEDEENTEDFYSSSKIFNKDNLWLFLNPDGSRKQ